MQNVQYLNPEKVSVSLLPDRPAKAEIRMNEYKA